MVFRVQGLGAHVIVSRGMQDLVPQMVHVDIYRKNYMRLPQNYLGGSYIM